MIFNIQNCSIHDGAGIRTLFFFKGCPLRCLWCANPESQSFQCEIMQMPSRCIGCGACKTHCPNNAVGQNWEIDRTRCTSCGKCAEVCYAGAKKKVGQVYDTEELYERINKDRPFYTRGNGGVTFSGGEPLLHVLELEAIAKMCHENGINVVVESCGMGDFSDFSRVLKYVDAMYIDIKAIDAKRHLEMTGSRNAVILSNINKIGASGIPITIRTPVVPGYTDDKENIRGIAEAIMHIPGIKEYELLKYHNFGESKYAFLGRDYALRGQNLPSDEEMNRLVGEANSILKGSGIECFWTKNNERKVIR